MFFPSEQGYTIYSKENCIYCDRVKELLQNETVTVYICDDDLDQNRDEFLVHMDSISGRIQRTFPFVFHNGMFIGGYDDTVNYYKSNLSFTEDF